MERGPVFWIDGEGRDANPVSGDLKVAPLSSLFFSEGEYYRPLCKKFGHFFARCGAETALRGATRARIAVKEGGGAFTGGVADGWAFTPLPQGERASRRSCLPVC